MLYGPKPAMGPCSQGLVHSQLSLYHNYFQPAFLALHSMNRRSTAGAHQTPTSGAVLLGVLNLVCAKCVASTEYGFPRACPPR